MSKKPVVVPLILPLLLLVAGPALAQEEDLASTLSNWPEYEPSVEQTRIAFDAAEAEAAKPDTPLKYSVTEPEPSGSDWRFRIMVYGWLAGVKGDVVEDGESTAIDIPFEDLADATESGFMLYAEMWWRELFFAFDGTWANLSGKSKGRLVDLDVDIRQRIFEMRLGANVLRRKLGTLDPGEHQTWQREAVVDVFVGVRYWETKLSVLTKVLKQDLAPIESKNTRWDPFLGFRFGWDFGKHWVFSGRADIGGFGIGNAAQFTWNTELALGYRLTSAFTFVVGYRALGYDLLTGSGADRSGTDLIQHGPLIGIGFDF